MLDIGLISIEKKDYVKLRNEIEHWKSAYNSAIETGNTLLAHERSVLNEEIERLRADHNDGVALTMAEHLIGELNGEVERLRGELKKQPAESLVVLDLKEQLMSKDTEIERLRDQVTRLSTLVDVERSLHDVEIEKLRENPNAIVQNAALTDEVMILKAEINQLNTKLNRTHEAVDNITDERDIFRRTLDKRDLEVERLQQDIEYYRELLKAAKVPEWLTIFRKTIV